MAEKKPLVTGSVILGGELKSFTNATVYVRLEDVSRADGAAIVAAEDVLKGVSHRAGDEARLEFALYGASPAENADYSLSVHVDVDADGEISRGDYISTQSYPVLTYGRPNRVEVRVEEVS